MQLSSNLQAIFFLHVFCKLMQISSNLQEAKKFSICGLEKSDATNVIKILAQNFVHFFFWGGGMCVLTLNP
jgi:hypothetical protein